MDGGPRKAARYFAGEARSANSDGHYPRVQLWKSDKRRDHAMSWTHAVASPQPSADAGAMYIPTTAGHKMQRTSTDFLPVDPVLSLDQNAARTDPAADHDGVNTENLDQWVTRRTKEFNVMTRENPNCEEIWLQFVDFQGEAVRALHGGGEKQPAVAMNVTFEYACYIIQVWISPSPRDSALAVAIGSSWVPFPSCTSTSLSTGGGVSRWRYLQASTGNLPHLLWCV